MDGRTVSKYQLSVCPHDTAKNGLAWFFLNTYLQRKLEFGIHFEPKDSFITERNDVLAGGYHLVYANPFSAVIFCDKLGFVPVAKPVNICDETVLVRLAEKPIPAAGERIKIASATDKLIVHGLGLSLLKDLGIAIENCDFEFVGTHVKAAHAVLLGNADLGFVFNETWNGMAQSSRQALAVVSETNTKLACHCFCISPEWSEHRARLQAILCGMKDDPKGRLVLEDLQFPAGFEAVGIDNLDDARNIMHSADASSGALTKLVQSS